MRRRAIARRIAASTRSVTPPERRPRRGRRSSRRRARPERRSRPVPVVPMLRGSGGGAPSRSPAAPTRAAHGRRNGRGWRRVRSGRPVHRIRSSVTSVSADPSDHAPRADVPRRGVRAGAAPLQSRTAIGRSVAPTPRRCARRRVGPHRSTTSRAHQRRDVLRRLQAAVVDRARRDRRPSIAGSVVNSSADVDVALPAVPARVTGPPASRVTNSVELQAVDVACRPRRHSGRVGHSGGPPKVSCVGRLPGR